MGERESASEPESSFRDKFVLQTVFRPVTGGYQVSGVKQFCSLGESADYYFVSGMREGSATAQEGLLSALIQRTAPGVKVEGTWNAMGMRGTGASLPSRMQTVSSGDVA